MGIATNPEVTRPLEWLALSREKRIFDFLKAESNPLSLGNPTKKYAIRGPHEQTERLPSTPSA